VLYEGTGLNGRSSIRRVNLETGNVLKQHSIGSQYSAKASRVRGRSLRADVAVGGIAFVYDRNTFTPKKSFRYSG